MCWHIYYMWTSMDCFVTTMCSLSAVHVHRLQVPEFDQTCKESQNLNFIPPNWASLQSLPEFFTNAKIKTEFSLADFFALSRVENDDREGVIHGIHVTYTTSKHKPYDALENWQGRKFFFWDSCAYGSKTDKVGSVTSTNTRTASMVIHKNFAADW